MNKKEEVKREGEENEGVARGGDGGGDEQMGGDVEQLVSRQALEGGKRGLREAFGDARRRQARALVVAVVVARQAVVAAAAVAVAVAAVGAAAAGVVVLVVATVDRTSVG